MAAKIAAFLNSSGALEALTSASEPVPGPISQLVIDDDVSRLREHMPARFGDDPRHMVQVNMSDDHHRDALGRNRGRSRFCTIHGN